MPQLVHAVDDPPPQVILDWHECTVVFRLSSGRVVTCDGWRYGTLVLHATWDDPTLKSFTVTHLPSKVRVFRSDDVDDAASRVQWLWEQCAAALSGDDVMVSSMPADAVSWLRENS